MILVYDYMASGMLADHLENSLSLTWKQCLNICIAAGRGLDYLHTGHSLIHRDVKASNILLDENFTAKHSDSGLAKCLSRSKLVCHVSTKLKGTFGYLDPDYLTTGKLKKKSDIYSFGVVVVEVLCGRRAVNKSAAEDELMLAKWAGESISNGQAEQLVAPNLWGEILKDSLKTFVDVAAGCLHDDPKKRSTMAQVVLQLEFALEQQDSSKSMVTSGKTRPDGKEYFLQVRHLMLLILKAVSKRAVWSIFGEFDGAGFPKANSGGIRSDCVLPPPFLTFVLCHQITAIFRSVWRAFFKLKIR